VLNPLPTLAPIDLYLKLLPKDFAANRLGPGRDPILCCVGGKSRREFGMEGTKAKRRSLGPRNDPTEWG